MGTLLALLGEGVERRQAVRTTRERGL